MPKSKSKLQDIIPMDVGTVSCDLELPTASDVVFRHTWCIKKYNRLISKMETLDSPPIKCAVNGLSTYWNLSIRFWRGANGKRVKNPIVVCLNLTKCETEESGQVKIRFQFGVWDSAIKHWECCPVSRVALNMENRKELLSVGYRDLNIRKEHVDADGDLSIMVKIQVIQSEEERHCLAQDLARVLSYNDKAYVDTEILLSGSNKNEEDALKAHSFIIRARSPMLASLLKEDINNNKNIKYQLNLSDLQYDVASELLRYLYSDKVDNLEVNANRLLPVATRYCLPGLTALCERALLETLTPSNVPNILLLADQCGCDGLRKAALSYCEDSDEIKENVQIGKTLAWKVMELVNPELFLEACESLGSSSGSNLDSRGSEEQL